MFKKDPLTDDQKNQIIQKLQLIEARLISPGVKRALLLEFDKDPISLLELNHYVRAWRVFDISLILNKSVKETDVLRVLRCVPEIRQLTIDDFDSKNISKNTLKELFARSANAYCPYNVAIDESLSKIPIRRLTIESSKGFKDHLYAFLALGPRIQKLQLTGSKLTRTEILVCILANPHIKVSKVQLLECLIELVALLRDFPSSITCLFPIDSSQQNAGIAQSQRVLWY